MFFARMCAGMAARPVCARMCACRCARTVGAHMLVGTVSKCCALVFCAHVRRKMAGRPVCARMCPCAHIVGAHMLVGTVSKNGFSLLSNSWHHYWIILSLLPPSWCGIVHFGGRVQGSAARTFFARMCAGMAARPVCARMCACRCAHTVGAHIVGIIWDPNAARLFFARMCAGRASSMRAHVSLRTHCRRGYASWDSFQEWVLIA